MPGNKDSIFATPRQQVADFNFDAQVAEVFPDMINRSVPGYSVIVSNIGRLAAQFVQSGTHIYDLGCSLGAATIAIKQQCKAENVQIIGIDNSAAMVERCQAHVNAYKGHSPVCIEHADIINYEYTKCSVISANFTLQFIDPEARLPLLQRLYDALVPGGILILSEKVTHESVQADQVLTDLHHEFKRDNGYSELEISQKRAALENVMRLDTSEIWNERLKSVGFTTVQEWYRCFNFTSRFAIKS